ncbi:MAG TPA: hypothetical protein VHK90_13370 [Thermoanaerobaculia bacterium]|nr:hypothetical protein [Thermoanaerobaculia bacterium]
MVRNCVTAVVLWLALMIAYAIYLWGDAPLAAAFVMGTVVWVGLVLMNGGRYALRDWHARNRMARGERPRDGDLVAATGEIRPTFDRLQAPFSGRDCVVYMYNAGPDRGESNAVRDYTGFGFARCAVYTPHGSFALGTFPMLEGFPSYSGSLQKAAQYIESTEFETIDGIHDMMRVMKTLHTRSAPFRIDLRIGQPSPELQEASERVVETGTLVTAIGRYSAAANAIVSDAVEKGFLRLKPGGSPYAISTFPSEAAVKFAGGLFVIVAANAVLWLYLTR